ncbi:MAG: FAD-dependent oxidoreductase [Nanoarchaeota archaeon]|nr:FAD-dependent oxidoreductase [Nanoarchaeota archaeon]
MMKKVVIIGAGPAGLFAAYELSKLQKYDISIIDKGKDIDTRRRDELNCGVGGAGLYSDGKLIYHTRVGTFLWQIVDLDTVINLNNYVKSELRDNYGIKLRIRNEEEQMQLENFRIRAIESGLDFVITSEAHIGTNRLIDFMKKFKSDLISKGVSFFTEEEVKKVNNSYLRTSKGRHKFDYLVLAPGRDPGSEWLETIVQRDFKFKFGDDYIYNATDVGVRVEVKREITDKITHLQRDMKFYVREAGKYRRHVRTFCTCPGGKVVMERHGGKGYNLVNGHSEEGDPYQNTNFAFLVTIPFTKPQVNGNEFARILARQAYHLSSGKVLLQRFGDLLHWRRSKQEKITEWGTQPSLKEAVAGSISLNYPHEYLETIIDGLHKLNYVLPGIASNDTLLYSPEIKQHGLRILTDHCLQTHIPNIYVAGDGPGLTRGIVAAAATGILAARGIMRKNS